MIKRLTRDVTKRDLIAKMLLDTENNFSVEQIAAKLGTTKGNVWKERSILRSNGILEKHDIGVFSETAEGDTIALARSETKMLVPQANYWSITDIPPLGQEDLKKMYGEFQNGKTPVEVIAANGFNPILVEYEYNRFCRMNGLNLRSLPHELVDVLKSTNNGLSALLLQKIEQDDITCNNDIRELVEFASTSSHSDGELSVIERMKKGDPIGEFKPFVCSICRKPMRGALFEPESEIGRKLLQSIGSGAAHDNCNFGFTSG